VPDRHDDRPGAVALAGTGLVIGAWGMVPPLLGMLDTALAVEVIDHQVPSVLVLAAAVIVLLGRQPSRPLLLACGFAVLLAGTWMAASHVPLVAQAATGQAPWPGTIVHATSALAVLALGTVWTWRYRRLRAAPPAETSGGHAAGRESSAGGWPGSRH
jgi:hypothetical protein